MIRRFLLVAAGLLVAATLWIAQEVYKGSLREQARCRQALALEQRWTPRISTLPLPADTCVALRMVRSAP